jgi:hypothetical protein
VEVERKRFASEKEMLDFMLPLMPECDNWAMSKTSHDFVAMYLKKDLQLVT